MGATHDPQDLSRSALIAASLTGLVSLAPTAHADPELFSVGSGTDFDTIYPTAASNGYASAQAGQIIGAAGTFCPDMEGPFDRWTNSWTGLPVTALRQYPEARRCLLAGHIDEIMPQSPGHFAWPNQH